MKQPSIITQIAKRVCPAVITIVVSKDLPKVEGFYLMPYGGQDIVLPKIKKGKREMTKIGGGSGFIVSPSGFIVSSCHVVADQKAEYTVFLDPQKKFPASVLARDPVNDIAILKINSAEPLPHISLGDSSKVEIGQDVVAIGNALGEFHDTVSSGIISGLSRFIQASSGIGSQAERLRGLIQTDAAINPGNSGGPLVDLEGNVIGINTAMIMGAQNIGFAIPINAAKKDLEEIRQFGKIKVPYMGIKYVIINKEMAETNKIPVDYGVLIVREALGESPIAKGSCAEKSGLKEFDIILEANGEKITVENALSHILQKCKVGQEIDLKVLRDSQEKAMKIKLDEKR